MVSDASGSDSMDWSGVGFFARKRLPAFPGSLDLVLGAVFSDDANDVVVAAVVDAGAVGWEGSLVVSS